MAFATEVIYVHLGPPHTPDYDGYRVKLIAVGLCKLQIIISHPSGVSICKEESLEFRDFDYRLVELLLVFKVETQDCLLYTCHGNSSIHCLHEK